MRTMVRSGGGEDSGHVPQGQVDQLAAAGRPRQRDRERSAGTGQRVGDGVGAEDRPGRLVRDRGPARVRGVPVPGQRGGRPDDVRLPGPHDGRVAPVGLLERIERDHARRGLGAFGRIRGNGRHAGPRAGGPGARGSLGEVRRLLRASRHRRTDVPAPARRRHAAPPRRSERLRTAREGDPLQGRSGPGRTGRTGVPPDSIGPWEGPAAHRLLLSLVRRGRPLLPLSIFLPSALGRPPRERENSKGIAPSRNLEFA